MKIFKAILRTTAFLLLVSQPAFAEEESKAPEVEQFGDWGRQCNTTPAGDELCFIFQNFHKEDTKQRLMSVRVFSPKDQKQPAMAVTLPLGIFLPAGASMMMNDVELVKMAYLVCTQEGCVTVPTLLADDVVTALKKGVEVSVRFAALNKQVIGLPVSLMGFTKAMKSITP